MKTIFTNLAILISFVSFGQNLTTIRVSVPNPTDEVYIVGNQKSMGDWQPDKVKLYKISEYEREISLDLIFPAEFKFTRGNWDSEAVVSKLLGQPNFVLNNKPLPNAYYKIQGWTDQLSQFSTYSQFQIFEINSDVLNQKRKLYISLPENYSESTKYPVVYMTDAHNLQQFEIVNQTIRQQSNFSNFPECIVVGIYINGRERHKELDITYGENGLKFKDFIFNEVISFVDKNYSTSSFRVIFGHSNGAEYNHYLMFEENNPFDAFINISENLADLYFGNFDKIRFENFLKTNKKKIKYFIASGEYDDPFRFPSGLAIEKIFSNSQNENVSFKHNIYKSWHTDLIARSVYDAFNFVFEDYQDYSLFENMLATKSFNYAEAKRKFVNKNEKYIIPYTESESSNAIIDNIVEKSKSSDLIKQYFDFEDPNFEMYEFYARSLYFYENANDLKETIKYLDKIVPSNDEVSVNKIVFSKAELYFKIYDKAGKKEQAYKNLEILLNKNPKFDLELKFILAKIGLENKLYVEKSKRYLKQVEKSFRENKVFDKKDVETLKVK